MSVTDELKNDFKINEKDLKVDWFSGSGKGGQHRNKHQNSCRLTHIPTGITQKAEARDRQTSYREAFQALSSLLQSSRAYQATVSQSNIRRDQMGSGMRGDKRRTYRFQDNIVTDHELGTKSTCTDLMNGKFEKIWS